MSCALVIAVTAHMGMMKTYNNIHPGFICDLERNFHVGAYYNSDHKVSAFVNYRTPDRTSHLWAEVGLATGYDLPVVPTFRVGYKNFFASPSYETSSKKVGLVLGLEYRM